MALDIGGTKMACGVISGLDAMGVVSVPTPSAEGPEAILEAAVALVRRATPAGRDVRLAVASAGVVDPVSGSIASATDLLPGWAGTRLREELGDRLSLPVHVVNDVHAHALGEYASLGGEVGSLLLVGVGTGVGGGLVVGGRVMFGARNMAGHVGHIDSAAASGLLCSCGRRGHLESVASGSAIVGRFASLTGRRLSGSQISELARREEPGSSVARHVLAVAGHALGRALAGLVNACDPEVVSLSGSVTHAAEPWRDALRRGFDAAAMDAARDMPIAISNLPNAALIGAKVFADQEDSR